MNRLLLLIGISLSVAGVAPTQPAGWQLQFSDDFTREHLGGDWSGSVAGLGEGAMVLGREGDMGNNFVATTRRFAGAQRLEFDALAPTDQPCDLTAVLNCDDEGYASGFLFGFGSQMNKFGQLAVKGESLKQYDLTITPRKWYKIVCQREGNHFQHLVDGKVVLDYTYPGKLPGPLYDRVGFYCWHVAQIDNVRVYTRPEQVQVTATAAEQRAAALTLQARAYPDPGKLVVSVEVPQVSVERLQLEVALRQGTRVLRRASVATAPEMREEVVLDLAELPAGEYVVAAEVPGQRPALRATASAQWPGRSEAFKGIRILNNFVWELVNTTWINPEGSYRFTLPCDRWVFVRTGLKEGDRGSLAVTLDPLAGAQPLYVQSAATQRVAEGMRFLRAGEHTVQVKVEGAELNLLQVRAVPEIQHSRYPTSVSLNQGVKYDWEFLQRHILPHVNTIIGSVPDYARAQAEQWRAKGGKWISYGGRPGLKGNKAAEASAESVAEFYSQRDGYTDPLLDGYLVDEFYHKEDPAYPAYAAGLKLLNARFPNKAFYPYAAGAFGKDEGSIPFARAALDGGGYVCWEAYLAEWANQKQALNAMRRYPERNILPLEEKLPGATRKTIWVFGAFSYPWPYADGYANVNYNAYLDMQFQMLATHPALFGLGGVHIWRSGYCDEERVRWFGRFFRHYCLEGQTSRVSADPYLLTHLRNGDFAEGVGQWTLEPAAADSITAVEHPKFGKFIGRYYRGPDSFLVTRRMEGQPNVFSQQISGLRAGRTYSLKLFTGDYGHLLAGKSVRQVHPVKVAISGAELLQGKPYSYQEPFPTRGRLDNFTDKSPFWLNYHWQVFRAQGTTAELRISDEPCAVGQQVLYTFVELKPFLMDHAGSGQ